MILNKRSYRWFYDHIHSHYYDLMIKWCALPTDLSKAVFNEFDTDGNGELVIPEYLPVWGRWARGK
jgi:hypothetical protein